MKEAYLEVTYRKGRAFAAYYYLPRRDHDTCNRTERSEHGLVVDYAADGRPIGIEITSPVSVSLAQLNALLERLGQPRLREEDFAPLTAA